MFATKKEGHCCEKVENYQKGMKVNVTTLEDLAKYIETDGVEIIDAVFVDPLGVWHHCSFCPSLVSHFSLLSPFRGHSCLTFMTHCPPSPVSNRILFSHRGLLHFFNSVH